MFIIRDAVYFIQPIRIPVTRKFLKYSVSEHLSAGNGSATPAFRVLRTNKYVVQAALMEISQE